MESGIRQYSPQESRARIKEDQRKSAKSAGVILFEKADSFVEFLPHEHLESGKDSVKE